MCMSHVIKGKSGRGTTGWWEGPPDPGADQGILKGGGGGLAEIFFRKGGGGWILNLQPTCRTDLFLVC